MKSLSLVLLLLLVVPEKSSYAYEPDFHYAWTYYLALHVGYTRRQAFQIASAAFSVDMDKDTGPMEATPGDVLFGANHPGLTGTSHPQIAKIWRDFHAFHDEELYTNYVAKHFGEDTGKIFDPDQQYIDPMFQKYRSDFLEDFFKNWPRSARAESLYVLALAQGNPGPHIHFTQDFWSHTMFSNVRGHVVAGHAPDFVSYSLPAATHATERTIESLQRFMRDSLKKRPKSPDMKRISQVLNQLSEANPIPGTVGNYFQLFEPLYGIPDIYDAPPAETQKALEEARKMSAPDLAKGINVIRRAIVQDEESKRLPSFAECERQIPDRWVDFNFAADGTVTGDPRYPLEKLELSLGQEKKEIEILNPNNFRVMIHLPYKISGFSGIGLLGHLSVTETVKMSDFNEPRVIHETRKPAQQVSGKSSLEEEYVIEMPVERGFSAFEQGSLSYTIGVEVCGLEPKSFTGTISLDEVCSERIETLRRLFPQLGMRADQVHQHGRALKGILANLSAIESDADGLVKKAEEVQKASMDLENRCAIQSKAEAENLKLSKYQLDQAAKSMISIRDAAKKLAFATCEFSNKAQTTTNPSSASRLAGFAQKFAADTRNKATEAEELLNIAKSAYDSIRSSLDASKPLLDESKQIRQRLDEYSKQILDLQKKLNDEVAGPDSPSNLKSKIAGSAGELETFFQGISAVPKACAIAAGSPYEQSEVLRGGVHAAKETAEADATAIQKKAQPVATQLASVEAIIGLLQEGSGPCESDSQTIQDIDLIDLSATLDTMDLYAGLVAESAKKAEECASKVQPLSQPSGLTGSGASALGSPLPPSGGDITEGDLTGGGDSGDGTVKPPDDPKPQQPQQPASGPRWALQEVKVSPDPYQGWTYSSGSSSATYVPAPGYQCQFQWTAPPQQIDINGVNMSVSVQSTPAPNSSLAAIIGFSTSGFESDNLPGEQRTAYAKAENGASASDQKGVMLRPRNNSTELEIRVSFMWAINFTYKYRAVQ